MIHRVRGSTSVLSPRSAGGGAMQPKVSFSTILDGGGRSFSKPKWRRRKEGETDKSGFKKRNFPGSSLPLFLACFFGCPFSTNFPSVESSSVSISTSCQVFQLCTELSLSGGSLFPPLPCSRQLQYFLASLDRSTMGQSVRFGASFSPSFMSR